MSEDVKQTPDEEVKTEQQAPQLTLADLSLALQTIQAVSQRGAIRAEEMETVGGLYTRLFKFLEAQGAIVRSAPTDEDSTQGE